MSENVFLKLIEELKLEKNKRMAVYMWNSVGDFYSLCSAVRYAEKTLNKEYILLYTDKQKEIIGWFCQDGIQLKGRHLIGDEVNAIYDQGLRRKFSEYFVFPNCGDIQCRNLVKNTSPDFIGNRETPIFPVTDIKTKYKRST